MKKIVLMFCMGVIAFSIACTDDTGSIINLPPSAVIATSTSVGLNEEVTLNGTGSFDADGDDLTYSWSFNSIPTGSNATINNASQATASFTTDVAGDYVVKLTVNDGDATAEDVVTIVASNGQVPVASITDTNGNTFGDGNVFAPGEEITVSGITSFDIEDGTNLDYSWEFTSQPTGSTATPATSTDAQFSFELDQAGDYTLQLTVTDSDDNMTTATVDIEIDFIPVLITSDINAVTVLEDVYDDPALIDYLVTKSNRLNVTSQLTVMAGVRMAFVDDSGLDLNVDGTLIAVGTASDSIVFRSESGEAGSWKGINIQSNKSANKLQFARVRDGGSAGFDGSNIKANVMVEDNGKITIANSTIYNGTGSGLYVRNLASTIPGFSANVITGNNVPVTCTINKYHYLDADTDFTGNTNDYINSNNGSATSENVTWNKLTVPYRIASSDEFISSTITVAPGARFIGQSESGFAITGDGSLNATGTANDIIIFEGEQDTEGVWRGLSFQTNNLNNKLIYARVSNGGQQGFDGANIKSNVIVQDNAQLIMQFTTLSNSAEAGLYVKNITVKLPDFSTNAFFGNNVPITIPINQWHYLDSNSDYSGNSNDYINGLKSGTSIKSEVTWNSLSVPYRIPNRVEFISDGGVTIEAGTQIISRPDGGIEVNDGGYLSIEGDASNPITLKGEQDVQGYWRGLNFSSNNPNNLIRNATISNGGSQGFDGANRKANVELEGSSILTMTNVNVTQSGGYGVRVSSSGVLTSSGLTFSSNALTGNQQGGGVQKD